MATIGIDLGTTYSCVAVYRRGSVEVIPNGQGNRTTPSYVAFTNSEHVVGDGALNQVAVNPLNTIFDAKRLIGRKFSDKVVQQDVKYWPFKVVPGKDDKPMMVVTYKGEEKKFAAEEISSMILSQMREIAESHLECTIKDAVVTVPAYFNDSQRRSTKVAGKIAGLNILHIINEPSAAALAYGLDQKSGGCKEKKVLIFDLGGGTFDISLLVMEDGLLQVKATAGDTHLGGEDFDHNMVNHFVQEFRRKHNVDIIESPKAIRRLRTACEKAKRFLSSNINTIIDVHSLYNGIDFHEKITRAMFEELNAELFTKCMGPLKQCLEDAKIDKSDVDEVVLVGGSTRIPKVQEMLREFFGGKALTNSINPDEAVANGAAIQGAMLSGDVQELVLLDVTPLSLGVAIKGDLMSVVVPRNTPIPTVREEKFTTTSDNQTVVNFSIYEGERSMASDNNLLGSFQLEGITPAPAHVPSLGVCFNIDSDGIMNVSATDRDTGKHAEITITKEKGELEQEEIDRMIEAANSFKIEDDIRKARAVAKNDLERYAYTIRNKLRATSTSRFVGQTEEQRILAAIDEALKWSAAQESQTEARAYNARRIQLENLWKPIEAKIRMSL